jgi:hypothetical protein
MVHAAAGVPERPMTEPEKAGYGQNRYPPAPASPAGSLGPQVPAWSIAGPARGARTRAPRLRVSPRPIMRALWHSSPSRTPRARYGLAGRSIDGAMGVSRPGRGEIGTPVTDRRPQRLVGRDDGAVAEPRRGGRRPRSPGSTRVRADHALRPRHAHTRSSASRDNRDSSPDHQPRISATGRSSIIWIPFYSHI